MKDFSFDFPTRIIFGRNAHMQVGENAAMYGKNAMILYGSDRIRNTGLLDTITENLERENIFWTAFGGIAENPLLSKVREGICLVREKEIDLLIAVGGGSVIDTAKAISLGSYYDGDVWDLFTEKARAEEVLPVGVVLTMAATASEANGVSVIWNREENVKCALTDLRVRPKFALLNPELTYTVPARQTAAGAVDIFAHAFERYIVKEQQGTLRDYLCESIMKTIIKELPLVLKQPDSYEHRSQIMWAATMAHSDMIGKEGDYACHALSHVFTETFGLAHGAALAILMPAWCQMMGQIEPEDTEKIFRNVWGADGRDFCELLQNGVERFRNFIRECGLPCSLNEAGLKVVDYEAMALRAVKTKDGYVGGGFRRLYFQDVVELLKMCD